MSSAVMVHLFMPYASKPSPRTWSVRLPLRVFLPWVPTWQMHQNPSLQQINNTQKYIFELNIK